MSTRIGVSTSVPIRPNACASGDTKSSNAESGCCLDHRLFELPHVPHHVTPDPVQVKNGIPDDLARTMVGDIAATIGVMEFHTFLTEKVFGNMQVITFAVAAQSNDVRMFAEE